MTDSYDLAITLGVVAAAIIVIGFSILRKKVRRSRTPIMLPILTKDENSELITILDNCLNIAINTEKHESIHANDNTILTLQDNIRSNINHLAHIYQIKHKIEQKVSTPLLLRHAGGIPKTVVDNFEDSLEFPLEISKRRNMKESLINALGDILTCALSFEKARAREKR